VGSQTVEVGEELSVIAVAETISGAKARRMLATSRRSTKRDAAIEFRQER